MSRGVSGLIAALGASLVFAASASANTYCVPAGGGAGCFNAGALDLQTALSDASANPGPDTVQVGAETLQPADCNSAGFTYAGTGPNSLTLVGAGALTVLTCPDNSGANNSILNLSGPVTVSDLSVHVPSGNNGRGVALVDGVAANGLTVTSDPLATNVIGVTMVGSSLTDSLIGTPLTDDSEAVIATEGASLDNDSISSGGTGVDATSGVKIVRSKISARRAVLAEQYDVTVRDTMIDVLPGSGIGGAGGLIASNTHAPVWISIEARQVSIVGTAPGSIGVDVEALGGQQASIGITDTVIHGPPTALKRDASANATANLTTSYDAYPAGDYAGTGTGSTTEMTPPVTADPGFAAPADPHVDAGSPLIDAGTPGPLFMGDPTVDLDGNPRLLDGNHDCVARRDIGAYEFNDPTPTAKVTASANRVLTGAPVTFHGVGCSNDPTVPVTFTWAFDDGGTATGVDVAHAFARAGTHRATLTVRDRSGNSAARTASVTVVALVPPTPKLSKLTVKPARFHVTQRRHKHFKLGTTISYRDTLAATTTFTVTQRARGVVKGKRCVAPPRHPAKHAKKPKKCTRTVTITTFAHRDKAGANSLTWSGKVKRRALKPGTYTLGAVARLAGRKSRAVSSGFTILG